MTGKVFLWLDQPGSVTTGSFFAHNAATPSISITSSYTADSTGTNETLTYNVDVKRQLSISSFVRTASSSFQASWQQNLAYTNYGDLTDYGNFEVNEQSTTGTDAASTGYQRQIRYPIFVNETYVTDPSGNYSISAVVNRGQSIKISGNPVFPSGLQSFQGYQSGYPAFQGSDLETTQNGSAVYAADPAAGVATSYGTTAQDMTFSGIEVDSTNPSFFFPGISGSQELYHRYVKAVNSTVTDDEETLVGRPFGGFSSRPVHPIPAGFGQVAFGSQKRLLGRGWGSSSEVV